MLTGAKRFGRDAVDAADLTYGAADIGIRRTVFARQIPERVSIRDPDICITLRLGCGYCAESGDVKVRDRRA